MKNLCVILLMQILLAASGQSSASVAEAPEIAPAPATASMGRAMPKMMVNAQGGAEQSLTEISEPARENNAEKKYIALRHRLQIETQAEHMQAAFDAAV